VQIRFDESKLRKEVSTPVCFLSASNGEYRYKPVAASSHNCSMTTPLWAAKKTKPQLKVLEVVEKSLQEDASLWRELAKH